MVYDADGNVKSVQDPRGHPTSYTYDSSNRMLTRTDPNNRVQNYNSYDANGNLTYFTDQKGQITCLRYDNLNRLTFVGFAANSACPSATTYQSTITYAWDLGNRIHQVTDSVSGTITRDWDNLDRLKDEITPQGTVAFTFDMADRLQTVTVPGQTAYTYSFDDSNRLQSINQGVTTLVTKTMDSADRLSSQTLPNGIVENYAYDNSNQLTGITYMNGSTTLGNIAYTFDVKGRVTTVGGSWGRSNIPAAMSSATYDSANQVTSRAGKTFTYDADGNLTNDGTNTYSWNARNQLTSFGSGASKLTFTYDGFGRRIQLATSKAATSYLYVWANPVQEIQAGNVVANQIPTAVADQDLARTDSSGTSSYLTDGLGSTVALADASKAITTQYTYDPFGVTTAAGPSSSNTYEFTGRQSDSSGLYYNRSRYYSPTQQRFISRDPIGLAGGDTNLYGYAGGSPTNFTDPSGTVALADTAAACVIGGAIGALGTWLNNSLRGRKSTVGDLVTGAAIGCAIGALLTLLAQPSD
jgi:RHS repeat-associated protein